MGWLDSYRPCKGVKFKECKAFMFNGEQEINLFENYFVLQESLMLTWENNNNFVENKFFRTPFYTHKVSGTIELTLINKFTNTIPIYNALPTDEPFVLAVKNWNDDIFYCVVSLSSYENDHLGNGGELDQTKVVLEKLSDWLLPKTHTFVFKDPNDKPNNDDLGFDYTFSFPFIDRDNDNGDANNGEATIFNNSTFLSPCVVIIHPYDRNDTTQLFVENTNYGLDVSSGADSYIKVNSFYPTRNIEIDNQNIAPQIIKTSDPYICFRPGENKLITKNIKSMEITILERVSII